MYLLVSFIYYFYRYIVNSFLNNSSEYVIYFNFIISYWIKTHYAVQQSCLMELALTMYQMVYICWYLVLGPLGDLGLHVGMLDFLNILNKSKAVYR